MESTNTKKSALVWLGILVTLFLLLALRYNNLEPDYFKKSHKSDVSEYYSLLSSGCRELHSIHESLYGLSTQFQMWSNITKSESEFQLSSSTTEGWLEVLKLNPNF